MSPVHMRDALRSLATRPDLMQHVYDSMSAPNLARARTLSKGARGLINSDAGNKNKRANMLRRAHPNKRRDADFQARLQQGLEWTQADQRRALFVCTGEYGLMFRMTPSGWKIQRLQPDHVNNTSLTFEQALELVSKMNYKDGSILARQVQDVSDFNLMNHFPDVNTIQMLYPLTVHDPQYPPDIKTNQSGHLFTNPQNLTSSGRLRELIQPWRQAYAPPRGSKLEFYPTVNPLLLPALNRSQWV